MKQLTKEQATEISELMSSIYQQGPSWVLKVLDANNGAYRLTRGLSERAARQRLKFWRKEKVEELLRSTPQAKAYALRAWHENPCWNGEGVWQWTQKHWYTNREDAEKALEALLEKSERRLEVFEMRTQDIPGHFVVA